MDINVSDSIIIDESIEKCLDYLRKLTDDLYRYFNLNEKILINIVDELSNDKLLGIVVAGVYYRDEMFHLDISKIIFDEFKNNNLYFIEGCIYHEFVHIYDLSQTKKTFKISYEKRKNKKAFLLDLGYEYWTEVLAYYKTFSIYKRDFDNVTTYMLTKKMKTIMKMFQNLYETSSEDINEIDKLYNHINDLAYCHSVHLAALLSGKLKPYEYSEKTTNSFEYQYTIEVRLKLFKQIDKIFSNPYSKKSKKRFIKIGKYLYKKIYFPFGLRIIKNEDKVSFGYYLE